MIMLTKLLSKLHTAAYKELLLMIKYVLDMKNLELKIEPMRNSKDPGKLYILMIATMQETW